MAFYLEKQKTDSTPYVLVDEEKKYIKFEGDSFHEDVIEFFSEINNWLEGYLSTGFGQLTFDCQMDYFNSSTAKILFNMLMYMDEQVVDDKRIIVNWIVAEDNDIIIEFGEDFEEEVNNLEFNIVIE